MSDLQRLSAISRVLGWICVALMVFLPASAVLLWLNFEALGQGMPDRLGIPREYDVPLALMPVQIALGLAVMMVPIGIMMFGLWNLRQLFVGFGAGRVFTIENTRFLRMFAWSTLAVIVVQFFANGLLAVVLTLGNPPGQRVLAFSLSTEHIIALFVGFVFVVIARVLEEGRKLADDNATIL
ncbi:MAG: DUF2975 domain-containing protein [Rhodospirillaceae bacterium]|nr:DUF2975 domain-containing protein [Rhodospirillaceae bacterium]